MNLIYAFREFMLSATLSSHKLLLSVSSGVDSMVLLDVASKALPADTIAVFHLHHGVREQADVESQFVQEYCSKKGIQFYGYRIDNVPEKDRENYWRKERKRLSAQAMQDFGAKCILTAHHATDLVETMIFRVVKGAGIEGMTPFDISTKPFWNIPKSEILSYAKAHNLEYFEDETNGDTDYERNNIRHNVIPHLRRITPNLEKVFVNEFQIFDEVRDFMDAELQNRCHQAFESASIELQVFLNLPLALQRAFLRYITHKTSFSDIEDCLRWLQNGPQGNSEKQLGTSILSIQKNVLYWT